MLYYNIIDYNITRKKRPDGSSTVFSRTRFCGFARAFAVSLDFRHLFSKCIIG